MGLCSQCEQPVPLFQDPRHSLFAMFAMRTHKYPLLAILCRCSETFHDANIQFTWFHNLRYDATTFTISSPFSVSLALVRIANIIKKPICSSQ
ncbi:MAG: hypothetical protein CL920_21505 [Deltaproteobacteria bacterium]|nr:hypothetical protein [Deltaproteobacteria bacterium]MBU51274.1 hypothetical protein [Deltaproteobacteria bacterium]